MKFNSVTCKKKQSTTKISSICAETNVAVQKKTLSAKVTTTTTRLHPFNGLFSRTACVSRYQKGKTSLDLNEARDNGVLGCSGISWTICKESAPRSREITTPAPHHSSFTGRMLFLTPNQERQSTKGNIKGN